MNNTRSDDSPQQQPLTYKKVAFTSPQKRQLPLKLRSLIRRLQQNYPFFADMLEEEVAEFLRLCRRESFDKEETIFAEGDLGRTFYLIVSGSVAILVGQKEVARMTQGQIFGEMAMLEESTRTASVITTEPSVLFSIDRNVLATRIPALGFKVVVGIARQLSDKLREANQLIRKLQAGPVQHKSDSTK